MRVLFADTFYRAALTSTEDSAHQRARELSRSLALGQDRHDGRSAL